MRLNAGGQDVGRKMGAMARTRTMKRGTLMMKRERGGRGEGEEEEDGEEEGEEGAGGAGSRGVLPARDKGKLLNELSCTLAWLAMLSSAGEACDASASGSQGPTGGPATGALQGPVPL